MDRKKFHAVAFLWIIWFLTENVPYFIEYYALAVEDDVDQVAAVGIAGIIVAIFIFIVQLLIHNFFVGKTVHVGVISMKINFVTTLATVTTLMTVILGSGQLRFYSGCLLSLVLYYIWWQNLKKAQSI